jgi:hypothetical protein
MREKEILIDIGITGDIGRFNAQYLLNISNIS